MVDCAWLKKSLEEYQEHSTAHGIAYIFSKNVKFSERIFWFLSILMPIIVAILWTRRIYGDWKSDPILTTVENFAYPIEKVKFPAITICPQGADDSIIRSVSYTHLTLPTKA